MEIVVVSSDRTSLMTVYGAMECLTRIGIQTKAVNSDSKRKTDFRRVDCFLVPDVCSLDGDMLDYLLQTDKGLILCLPEGQENVELLGKTFFTDYISSGGSKLPCFSGSIDSLSPPNEKIPIFGRFSKCKVKNRKLSLSTLRSKDGKRIGDSIIRNKSRIMLSFDLFTSIGYILSGKEQIDKVGWFGGSILDVHKRFNYDCSTISGNLLEDMIIISEYERIVLNLVTLLSDQLKIPLVRKWKWPKGRLFTLCLTHDVLLFFEL